MTAYPQFGTAIEDGVNSGTTEYDALQVSAVKRAGHGLSVIGSFAWQKTMHNNVESLVNNQYLHHFIDAGYVAANGGTGTPTLINWRSIGAYDQPKVWRVSVVYSPQIKVSGSGFRAGMLQEAVQGWEITNWWEATSGLLLAISGASGFGRPAITCDPRGSGPINQRLGAYFNQSCFQQLTSKYFPMISPTPPYRSYLRAPIYDDVNTSLMKTFATNERVHVQLRAEAYNTLNHPLLQCPWVGMCCCCRPAMYELRKFRSNHKRQQFEANSAWCKDIVFRQGWPNDSQHFDCTRTARIDINSGAR